MDDRAPLTLIVPEVVGSAADLLSRILGDGLAAALGRPVLYENLFLEAGVGRAARAAPDGRTLLYGSSGNLALLPHVKKVAFDPLRDFVPVARFSIQPSLLAVNPALSALTLPELVALMKAQPGRLRMSTAGAGTSGHFAGELFLAAAGVTAEIVHYAGGGPAIEAVVANDSQWTMAPIAGRLPHVHGGRLRALAVGSPQRLAALPAVPTIAEAGYAECDVVGWGGIFAPAGTPPATIERLHAAIAVVVARAEVQRQFAAQGVTGVTGVPAELAQLLRDDFARFGVLAGRLGLAAV